MIRGRGETLDSIRDIKIFQRKKGYRFSAEAVILSSFVSITQCRLIADLGAGSGIISILLAKKYPVAKIYAVEIQRSLSDLTRRNIVLNNLEDRVVVITEDIRRIPESHCLPEKNGFDLIVSNPPFRRPRTGLISPEEERAIARHEIKLTIEELLKAGSMLLKTRGRFDLIYHPVRLIELLSKMRKHNLEPKRLRFIHSNEDKEAKMVLVEAVKEGRSGMKIDRPLYIYNSKGDYTEEMKEIYGI